MGKLLVFFMASGLLMGQDIFNFQIINRISLSRITASPCLDGQVPTYVQANLRFECATPPGATGGQANTASNLGGGTGVFAAKVLEDLQFKSLVSANTGIVLTNDANTITFTLTPSNITLQSLGGALLVSQINASGTANSTTALFGDASWKAVALASHTHGIGDITSATDDTVAVGNGSVFQAKALPNCNTTTEKLHYDIATNAFSCQTDQTGAGGGAPTTSQYVTLALDGGLSAERVLTAGAGVTVTDGGANGNVTIASDTAVMESRATAQAGTTTYCRSTTGNDTYTCTLNPALTGYTRGMVVRLDADTANTGTATLDVQSLGAISILKRDGTALSDGDITANRGVLLYYNGTNFNIIGDGGGAVGNEIYSPLTAFDDSTWTNGAAVLTRNTSVAGRVRYTIGTAAGILATRQKSVAAGDFTFRVGIIPYFTKGYNGGPRIGVVLGDSGGTQKLRFCGVSINGSNAHSFISETWDSYFNTPSAEALDAPFNLTFSAENFGRGLIWLEWSRVGSALTCKASQDGKIWETVRTTDQTYLTATFVGVGGTAATDGSSARFTVFGGTIP